MSLRVPGRMASLNWLDSKESQSCRSATNWPAMYHKKDSFITFRTSAFPAAFTGILLYMPSSGSPKTNSLSPASSFPVASSRVPFAAYLCLDPSTLQPRHLHVRSALHLASSSRWVAVTAHCGTDQVSRIACVTYSCCEMKGSELN